MKKIIVTGATSMLGVATIEECLKNNIEVIAITRRNSKNMYRMPSSEYLQVIEKNLDELASYTPENISADVFYHFGWAATSHKGRMDIAAQELNIRHTLDAVQLAKKFNCKKFIFAGSQAEYGLSSEPLNRETSIKPITPYGVSKFAAGKLAEILCSDLDINFVEVRIVSTYGVNDSPSTLISYIMDCYKKNIQPCLTPCEQIWDYLYSEDAARAFRLLGEKFACGVYCLGSGMGKPLKDYVKIIYDLMKPDVPLIFGGKPYSQNQIMYLQADISALQRDIGFVPKFSFENAIAEIITKKYPGGGGIGIA